MLTGQPAFSVPWPAPAGSAPAAPRQPADRRRRVVTALVGVALAGAVVTAFALGTTGTSSPHQSSAASSPAPLAAGRSGAAAGAPTAGAALNAAGSGASAATGSVSAAGPTQPDVVPQANPAAKVVKTGTADLVVARGGLEDALGRLTSLAAAEGGFVAATTTADTPPTPSGSVTLRVPSASFEATLNQVRRVGTVRSLATSGQDVTSRYVDLQERITALQAAQGRYLAILAQATTIGDILSVQQQVDSIQTQLDQLEGQQQVMDDQTTYATLTVDVTERTPPGATPPSTQREGWSRAWHDAVHGFAAAAQGIVAAAGVILFVGLCLVVLAGLTRITWRRVRRPAN